MYSNVSLPSNSSEMIQVQNKKVASNVHNGKNNYDHKVKEKFNSYIFLYILNVKLTRMRGCDIGSWCFTSDRSHCTTAYSICASHDLTDWRRSKGPQLIAVVKTCKTQEKPTEWLDFLEVVLRDNCVTQYYPPNMAYQFMCLPNK